MKGQLGMQSDIESAFIGINHLAERLDLSRRTIHRILAGRDSRHAGLGTHRNRSLKEHNHYERSRTSWKKPPRPPDRRQANHPQQGTLPMSDTIPESEEQPLLTFGSIQQAHLHF